MNPLRPVVDPLDAARQQLDFEALAERAPSSKEILFKAQTIVPLATPRPWDNLAKGTGALGLAAVLLFAPLVPDSASLAMVSVQFEQQKFTRSEAQELVYGVLRDLPDDVLLGAGFARAPGQPANDSQGKLQLSLIRFNESPNRLAAIAGDAVMFKPRAGSPFYTGREVARRTVWNSIPRALGQALQKPAHRPQPPLDQFAIAHDVLAHEDLIRQGLRRHYQSQGYELASFAWLAEPEAGLPAGADFMLPAWPHWVSIDVTGYELMMDGQQAEIRLKAEDFLDQLNLGTRGVNFSRESAVESPLVVSVVAPGNTSDPYLSGLVQAELAPELAKLEAVTAQQAEQLVYDACARVFPQNEVSVSVRSASRPGPGAVVSAFRATVKVGAQIDQRRWRVERNPLEQVENETEF